MTDHVQSQLHADTFHRGVKMAIDAGEVDTVEQGVALFQQYRLGVRVGTEVAHSLAHQVALLTIVNTARRAMLGGVQVCGDLTCPLLAPLPGNHETVAEAVKALQGEIVEAIEDGRHCLLLGDALQSPQDQLALTVSFDGWRGGAWPYDALQRLPEASDSVLSAILAAGMGVSEAFQNMRGYQVAGSRVVGMSLWDPAAADWYENGPGPHQFVAPTGFWILGLGHLGQAYVWTLGMLPFCNPSDVVLTLQDFDQVTLANDSTSVLTQAEGVGEYKTRLVGNWAERRGFKVKLVERAFLGDVRVGDNDPRILLCGVDNPQARALMETAGFDLVVEAGLGGGPKEYLAMRLHCFPASRTSEQIWGGVKHVREQVHASAYDDLKSKGAEACGLVELATRTVGAPFVGVIAATLVIAETIRRLNNGPELEVLDMTLRAPDLRSSAPKISSQAAFNPGFGDLHFKTPEQQRD